MKKLYSIFSIVIISCCLIPVKAQDNMKPSAAARIATIIKNTGSQPIPNTVDVIKEGDQETPVTGIVTTMFATMKVLEQAVAAKCNLIIVHEPLYYNHLDEKTRFQNDPVFQQKRKYILDNKLVIWRFHDYIHSMKPDGIMSGMVTKLGWKNYMVNGLQGQFVLPEMSLKELLEKLKKIFPENSFYVVGNPEMQLTNVRLAPGSSRQCKSYKTVGKQECGCPLGRRIATMGNL